MRFRITALFAFVVGLMMLSGSIAAQRGNPSAEALLRAATDKEVVDGDLEGAIKLYETIVSTYGKANRPAAAQALLQMAGAYQKLRDGRAWSAYERIVHEFPDQAAVASEAATRLTATGRATATSRSTSGPICIDCVTDARVALSRDARWMAIPDSKTGQLTIRELVTGQVTRLTDTRVSHPVFSPDARRIAYSVGGDGPHQLRIMPNQAGGPSQVLVNNPEFEYVVPVAWSPDGARLLVQISHVDETWQTAWVSVADRSVKVLKSLDWRREAARFEQRPALSPDGRFIAYAALAANPSKPGGAGPNAPQQIYVIAADGTRETQLTTNAGLYGYPTWTPDGRHIVFRMARSNSGGPFDLWSVPVTEGRAGGPPSLVKADVGTIIGMGPSGSLYYALSRSAVPQFQVTGVPIASATAEALHVTHRFVGMGGKWSPDGRFIASFGPASGGIRRGAGAFPDVRIGSLETGEQRVYSLPPGSMAMGGIQWLNNGSALLVQTQKMDTGSVWMTRLDMNTGRFSELGSLPESGNVALSSDDKTLYFVTVPAARSTLSAIDLASWQFTTLLANVFGDSEDFGSRPNAERLAIVQKDPSAAAIFGWRLSPDRKTLLLANGAQQNGYLATMSIDTGSFRALYAPSGGQISDARWMTNDEILFTEATGVGPARTTKVMRVTARGGTPEFRFSGMLGLNISPDGSRVAYGNSTTSSVELWALDVSPLLK